MLRWQRLNENILSKDRRYRKELLGSEIVDSTSDEYNLISMVKESGSWTEYETFKQLPLHTRAKFYAHHYLQNIIEVLQRHDDLMDKRIRDRQAQAEAEAAKRRGH